jgi:hypothetical protein
VGDQAHQPADDLGLEGFGGAFFALHQKLQQQDSLEQNRAHLFLD